MCSTDVRTFTNDKPAVTKDYKKTQIQSLTGEIQIVY